MLDGDSRKSKVDVNVPLGLRWAKVLAFQLSKDQTVTWLVAHARRPYRTHAPLHHMPQTIAANAPTPIPVLALP